jgi:hypothetical protein
VAVGGFTRGQRWLGAAEGLGTALVVLLVVAVVTYAATRPTLRRRLDLTEGAQYTLSEQTRQILADLPQPVTFVELLQPEVGQVPNGLYEVQARAIEYVDNLLREYEIASNGQITVRRLSPHADRLEAEDLAHEFNLTRYNVVVVRGPQRHRVVTLEDMATIDRGYSAPPDIQPAQLLELHGEAPLTSALLDVSQKNPPRVGFLKGFGGPSTADTGDFGLFLFKEQVRGQGLQPEDVDLTSGAAVPDGLVALVVWGPELPIGPRVRDALLAYHNQGGALLLGVDPLHDDPDLEDLLHRLGVQRERAVLCRDDLLSEGMRRSQLAVTRFEDHAITAPLAQQGTFVRVAAAGGLARSSEAAAGTTLATLLVSPDQCFGDLPAGEGRPGDFTLGEGEVRGARQLGVAVTATGKAGRVVVFGTSTFLTTSFLRDEGGPANADLGLNAISWLVQRESAIAARPKQVYESRVDLTPEEQGRIVLYVVVLMPLGGVALGVLVWLARRR